VPLHVKHSPPATWLYIGRCPLPAHVWQISWSSFSSVWLVCIVYVCVGGLEETVTLVFFDEFDEGVELTGA